jgi:hypothetical protein
MVKRGVFLGLIGALATTFVAAGPAQAIPSGCASHVQVLMAYGYCNRGSGEFRIHATCDIPWAPDKKLYGSWRLAAGGSDSLVYCPNPETRSVKKVGFDLREEGGR